MPIVPDRDVDAIQFFEQHTDTWTTNATVIGLTSAQAMAVKNAAGAARTAFTAALAAREASKVATQTQKTALTLMRSVGGSAINTIRAFAESTNNPGVYDKAMIPPPSAPTQSQPPEQATSLKAILDAATGAIKITWKAAQPEGGTSYIVTRRIGGDGDFAFLGVATGRKSFVDSTIPFGATHIEYVVQGQRGTLTGPASSVLVVQFGASGGGMTSTVRSVSSDGIRMAA